MRRVRAATLCAALFLASACTAGRVASDFDETHSFAGYRTLAWANDEPMTIYGDRKIPPTLAPKITRTIKSELKKKGFMLTENLTEADFAVSFTVGKRDGFRVIRSPDCFSDSRSTWGWGVRYYPIYARTLSTLTDVTEYTEGRLAIDVYDVPKRAPVWHGVGVKNLSFAELNGQDDKVVQGVT
ncbi:MAG: DUF4136 domain-containing protein [Pseudomonadota bacterium]